MEYVLFCPLYEESLWDVSPMNAKNNVNGVGRVPRTEVFTLKHADLLRRQLAFVRKVVTELNAFDNVYFEICNEPYFGGVTLDWQRRIADEIVATEARSARQAPDRPEHRQRQGQGRESAPGRLDLQLPLRLASRCGRA